jgi:hypothetical protein
MVEVQENSLKFSLTFLISVKKTFLKQENPFFFFGTHKKKKKHFLLILGKI